MFGREKKVQVFFDNLCEDYYGKVLNYLFSVLLDETAAYDCAQDVFLVTWQKRSLLQQHPNPGGFIFQTAKNLAKKAKRESFQRLLNEKAFDEDESGYVDGYLTINDIFAQQVDEQDYIETVLSQLSDDKRHLYSLYYVLKKSMEEIAIILGVKEPAVRMRYVRLRREIRDIATKVADQYLIS